MSSAQFACRKIFSVPMKNVSKKSSLSLIPPVMVLVLAGMMGGSFLSRPTGTPKSSNQANTTAQNERSGPSNADQSIETPSRPLFHLLETLPERVLTGLPENGEAVPNALMMLDSTSIIAKEGLDLMLNSAAIGEAMGFPTPKEVVPVRITASRKDPMANSQWIAGVVHSLSEGAFALVKDENSGKFSGHLLLHRQKKAFVIEEDGTGRLLLQERPIDAVICSGMPPEPNPVPMALRNGVEELADPVPILDSLPGAEGVLYIDFDGEIVTNSSWKGGATINALPAVMAGRPMTAEQMTAVWAAVAEDFAPFNVSVTTSVQRYNGAPRNRRMRCIQTPTNDAAPTAGGVAYLNSFSDGSENPCWSYNSSNVRIMALTISHELGHTVGLLHDGRVAPSDEEYYGGHGTGVTRWGPIMGAPFSAAVTQWSKGEYYLADRTGQDDLTVITRPQNFGYRTDEAADTTALAANVSDNIFGNSDETGFITTPTDKDVFRFQTAGGTATFNGTGTALPEGNLDIKLRILRNDGSELVAASPVDSLNATLSTTLSAGTYFVEVSGTGFGTPLENPPSGYTNYGSLGQYSLKGTFVPLPQVPLITQQPTGPPEPVLEGRAVTFSVSIISNRTPRFQWIKIVDGVESNISGATGRTYMISSPSATHIADYKVRVSNSAGSVDSDTVSLDVFLKPRFTVQPLSGTVQAGNPLTLNPTLTGDQPMTLQWWKNNAPIQNANAAVFNIPTTQWSDEGSYKLVATNAAGTTTSSTAVIKMESPPVVIQDLPSLAIKVGSSATLSLTIRGNPTFSYQWFKGDMLIPGAIKSSLVLKGDPTTTPGIYKLRVTNRFGDFTSSGTDVTVDYPVVISQHPLGATGKSAGGIHSMNVLVTGTLPQYQWQLNGKDIPGATGPDLVMNPLTWFNNGKYRVVVWNRVSRVVSREATLSVTSAPVILTQPASRKAARRGSTTFTVKAQGTGRLSYQWFKGEDPIVGAKGTSLRISKLDTPSEGDYRVKVSNSLGETPSDPASLVVEDVPVIVLNPTPGAFEISKELTLGVNVSGSPTFRYQWQRNKKNLPGQTGESLLIPNAQISDTALYRVVVTNDVGSATSREARATVMLPPSIVTQPVPVTQYQGFNATFTIKAAGTGPLTYRWKKDGTIIKTTTTPTLSLTNLQLTQAGSYSVEVANAVKTIQSDAVPLDVQIVPSPVVTNHVPRSGQAKDKVAVIGSNLQFAKSATLSGTPVGFVVTTNNDVVVTSPTNATSGLIRITTPGGNASTTANFTVATDFINNNFSNSIVVTTGTYSVRNVDTEDYTAEVGEPGYFTSASKSAWWRWTCPETGSYQIDTRGSSYDTTLTVFSGDALNSLTRVAANDDAVPGAIYSQVVLSAIRGIVYRISVDTVDPDAASRADLNIQKAGSSSLAGNTFEIDDGLTVGESVVKAGGWQGTGAESTTVVGEDKEDQAVLLGGSDSENSAQIWHPALAEGAISSGNVTTGFSARLVNNKGSSDQFAWTLYAPDGTPVAALRFDSGNGTLQAVNAAGQATMLDPILQENCEHRFDLTLHLDEKTWSVTLDGVKLLNHLPLEWPGETSPAFGDASASWERGSTGPAAGMIFDDFSITTSTSSQTDSK
jgi:Immunoglobulin I-set domain